MLQLSSDETFHYELLRVLAYSRYFGADVAEVLQVADTIEPGNFESWYTAFNSLAERTLSTINQDSPPKQIHDKVTLRDVHFRASSYYRAADFFLHGSPSDPRINTLWKSQIDSFDKAISLLPIPGVRHTIQANGFTIPVILYRASLNDNALPTLLMGNGYDGAQEEMLHVHGFAALERGYNVITYEGPGQPSVVREQSKSFIAAWETVVSPIIDHLETLPWVDKKRIGLTGYSMGGYLCARAAAFEPRLAAVMCVDGVFDVFLTFSHWAPPAAKKLLEQGSLDAKEREEFDQMLKVRTDASTGLRWAVDQAKWSFMTGAFEAMRKSKEMCLKGVAERIKCPVFVGEAEHDQFFMGQPQMLADAVGERATLVRFEDRVAAAAHCQVGAAVHLNQTVLGWFAEVIANVK